MIAEVVQGFLKWRAQVCLCLRREGWEGVAWMAPYYAYGTVPGNLYLHLEQGWRPLRRAADACPDGAGDDVAAREHEPIT